MVYGFENLNVDMDQISSLLKNSKYKGFKIDKTFVQELFRRYPSGRIIAPSIEEDAEVQLIKEVKEGDVVITSTFANFSSSLAGMLVSLDKLISKKVRVISILEEFDSDSTEGEALISSIPALLRFNDNGLKSRRVVQKQGIEKAQEQGKYLKRNTKTSDNTAGFFYFFPFYMTREITKNEFSDKLNISRPTLNKLLKEDINDKDYLSRIDYLKKMKRIEMKNGYLICPDDWIVLDICEPLHSTNAVVIEFKNNDRFNIPHFVFFTDRPLDKEIKKEAIMKAVEFSPSLKQLSVEYPEVLDVTGKFTAKQLKEDPIPGFFIIPEAGETMDKELLAFIERKEEIY